jgi:FKBP-type peptidyl-prolyl cis-trans isomerase FklB
MKALALAAALALASSTLAMAAPAPTPAAAAPADPASFLAQNAKTPGVIVLPSGLQYKVVKSGDPKGPSPKAGDAIKVNYEGRLVDGTVFDSSFQRGKAALMPLGGLIPAWMEALPHMHPGDEWILYAPPELGYGPDGQGPIPPNSVLVFRIQLVGMLSAD